MSWPNVTHKPLPFFLLLLLLLLVSLSPSQGVLDQVNNHKSRSRNKEVIKAHHGAVAADDGRCSRIGRNVLREGGNAVDAAVATALCLGVVSPASSGIGGGAFMVVRLANGTMHAIDMRETAPSKAFKDMYAGNATLKANGALSVAVPGEVAGLYKVWKMHGKLRWRQLVRPAEQLARGGFKISPYLYTQMTASNDSIFQDEGLRNLFTSKGKLLQPGDVVRNVRLARTLRAISRFGAKALYDGAIGQALVEDIQKLGGIITLEDLKTYQVRMRDPIVTDFESLGLKIIGMPPPSSGGPAMILILNILSLYGFPEGVSGSLGVHRLIEALKHAFAVRMNLGDPDFVNSVPNVVADMLSPKFAAQLKSTINDNKTFDPNYYGAKWNILFDHGTSHLSIVDADRNAVSMTSTVNSYFGSKILSPSTGIVLNNEMDDFSIPLNVSVPGSLPPTPANFVKAGKRPLSSMTPTIVLKDGELKGVVGASGGAMIIAATTEVFLNHFAKRMDPFSSVISPRVYHQLIPNKVKYENWTTVTGDHIEVPARIRKDLEKKGHVLEALTSGGAITQFIVQNKHRHLEELVAVSDPRKGGFPAGY